jgi:hypothetical protein
MHEGCDYGRSTRWTMLIVGSVILAIMSLVVAVASNTRADMKDVEKKLSARIDANQQSLAVVTQLSARIDERLKAMNEKLDDLKGGR